MVRQMNNTIKNKMVTVPKGIKLNDEDYLNSVLSYLSLCLNMDGIL